MAPASAPGAPMQIDLDELKRIAMHPTAIGGLGALSALRFIPGSSFWERLMNAVVGLLISAFVSPLVVDLMSLGPRGAGAVAFLLGLFGVTTAGQLFRAIERLDLASVISGWLERRPPPQK